MYKIIGADQKEYGPVPVEQVRYWISQNRVNARTLVQVEGEQEWKPLGSLPEFVGAFGPAPLPVEPEATTAQPLTAEELSARDYSLDIGSCISRGWSLVKEHFWALVGMTLLITLITGMINQVIGLIYRSTLHDMVVNHTCSPAGIALVVASVLVSAPLDIVLKGGLVHYYLKLMRGERASAGDAFYGFGALTGPLVLLGLVGTLLTSLGLALCVLPGVYLATAWYFALPLVVDRHLDFWSAMELSRRVVSKHWFLVFGLILVISLVAVAGFFACCIGIFVTIPIAMASFLYAYEDLFGQTAR